MGIYIKGMEMPKEGEYHMTLYVCSDGSAYMDVASFPVDEDRFEAVPVPPHGRLIDADELINNTDIVSEWGDESGCSEEKINDAPTIIPSEK